MSKRCRWERSELLAGEYRVGSSKYKSVTSEAFVGHAGQWGRVPMTMRLDNGDEQPEVTVAAMPLADEIWFAPAAIAIDGVFLIDLPWARRFGN